MTFITCRSLQAINAMFIDILLCHWRNTSLLFLPGSLPRLEKSTASCAYHQELLYQPLQSLHRDVIPSTLVALESTYTKGAITPLAEICSPTILLVARPASRRLGLEQITSRYPPHQITRREPKCRPFNHDGAIACDFSLFNSSSCEVSPPRISDIGHACSSMPFENGRIMFLTARVDMHVYSAPR